jgi:hypothetical protein
LRRSIASNLAQPTIKLFENTKTVFMMSGVAPRKDRRPFNRGKTCEIRSCRKWIELTTVMVEGFGQLQRRKPRDSGTQSKPLRVLEDGSSKQLSFVKKTIIGLQCKIKIQMGKVRSPLAMDMPLVIKHFDAIKWSDMIGN